MYLATWRIQSQSPSACTLVQHDAAQFHLRDSSRADLRSFLNVCISRLPRHESVVAPRSRCPLCRAPIRSYDNIPVLSWILLRGRCRNCGNSISVRYPLIELATAALFLLCSLAFVGLHAVGACILCWLLLGLAATDAETLILPDALTLPGIGLGILTSAFPGIFGDAPLFSARAGVISLLSATAAALFLLLIRWTYWLVRRREGLGLGDVKLIAMIAAWLGLWEAGLALFFAVVAGAIYGITRIALQASPKLANENPPIRIPLGAFLSAAGILGLFQGQNILNWYLKFFP